MIYINYIIYIDYNISLKYTGRADNSVKCITFDQLCHDMCQNVVIWGKHVSFRILNVNTSLRNNKINNN